MGLRASRVRNLLLEAAGETEEVWPERGLYGQLEELRMDYRGEPFDLPKALSELTEEPRWRFLFEVIRDAATWTRLLDIAWAETLSDDEKIAEIILTASQCGVTLDPDQAGWFLPSGSDPRVGMVGSGRPRPS